MAGFENGRLQTAARAVGVMQAAYEAAKQYAEDRVVFGTPISELQLTKVKLARMPVTIQACRPAAYAVAKQEAKVSGRIKAGPDKAYIRQDTGEAPRRDSVGTDDETKEDLGTLQ